MKQLSCISDMVSIATKPSIDNADKCLMYDGKQYLSFAEAN